MRLLQYGVFMLLLALASCDPRPPMRSPLSSPVALRKTPLVVSENQALAAFHLRRVEGKWLRPQTFLVHAYRTQGDVVCDAATGLTWQRAGSATYLTYRNAQHYVERLNRERYAGYDDWRLPTVDELLSLMESSVNAEGRYINPLFASEQRWCWSADRRDDETAWGVDFWYGDVYPLAQDGLISVRAVRSNVL